MEASRLSKKVASQSHAVDLRDDKMDEEFRDVGNKKWATEVHDLLLMVLKGDAVSVPERVPDMNGLESWGRVYLRYNSSTPASVLTALIRVIAPDRVKHRRNSLQKCGRRPDPAQSFAEGSWRRALGEDPEDCRLFAHITVRFA